MWPASKLEPSTRTSTPLRGGADYLRLRRSRSSIVSIALVRRAAGGMRQAIEPGRPVSPGRAQLSRVTASVRLQFEVPRRLMPYASRLRRVVGTERKTGQFHTALHVFLRPPVALDPRSCRPCAYHRGGRPAAPTPAPPCAYRPSRTAERLRPIRFDERLAAPVVTGSLW